MDAKFNQSPNTKFPRTACEFHHRVEVPLWTHAITYANAIVDAEDFDYVIVADENGEPCLRSVGGETYLSISCWCEISNLESTADINDDEQEAGER